MPAEERRSSADLDSQKQQSSAIFNAALECLAELVTRNAENCREAVNQRAVPLLTSYISSHADPPPNPAALRVLHQMVTCKAHAEHIHENIMTCLTIPALVHLLNSSLVHAGQHCGVREPVPCACLLARLPVHLLIWRCMQFAGMLESGTHESQMRAVHALSISSVKAPTRLSTLAVLPARTATSDCAWSRRHTTRRTTHECVCVRRAGAWATEVLSVLAPLVRASQEAAEQLLTLGGLHALGPLLRQPEREPLPLSMMLDIVEVLVARGDAAATAEVRGMLVRDGLLAPVLHALHHPGLSRQAIAILCHMAPVRTGHARGVHVSRQLQWSGSGGHVLDKRCCAGSPQWWLQSACSAVAYHDGQVLRCCCRPARPRRACAG